MKAPMVAMVLLLAACAALPAEPGPPQCDFPDGTHFAYIGFTTSAALGLPNGDDTLARWWVTVERVPWTPPMPAGGPKVAPSRQACGILGDGSTMLLPDIPEAWQPPSDASP